MSAVAQNPVLKRQFVSLANRNTWEALKCVRLHQKAPEAAWSLLKVLTLARAKMFEFIVLYVGLYGGT